MNDWNHWEKQMRSWKPRAPSARVKERLLAAASRETAVAGEWQGSAWWLAPAMACMVLAAAWFNGRPSPMTYLTVASTNTFWEENVFQHAGYAAYFAGAGNSYQNQSPSRFEVPFRAGLSLEGMTILHTNNLIR